MGVKRAAAATVPATVPDATDPAEREERPGARNTDDLQFWFSSILSSNPQDLVTKVYQYVQTATRAKRLYLATYNDEMIDEDKIGLDFGSGNYEIISRWRNAAGDWQVSSKEISISPRWDSIKRKHDIETGAIPPAAPPAPPPAAPAPDLFTMAKEIIALIVPLMNRPQPAAQDPAGSLKALDSMANMAGRMIEKQSEKTMDLIDRFAEERMNMNRDPDDSEVSKFAELIKTYLPLILSMGKPQQIETINGIKKAPDVRALLDDRNRVEAVISALKEKGVADDTIRAAIEAFGIKPIKVVADPGSPA